MMGNGGKQARCYCCGCTDTSACWNAHTGRPCAWAVREPHPFCDNCTPNLAVVIEVVPWGSRSPIRAVGYHEPSRTLEVRFASGARYRYGAVDRSEALPLLASRPPAGFAPGQYLSDQFVMQPRRHPVLRLGLRAVAKAAAAAADAQQGSLL